jgi:hypothetical protein
MKSNNCAICQSLVIIFGYFAVVIVRNLFYNLNCLFDSTNWGKAGKLELQ